MDRRQTETVESQFLLVNPTAESVDLETQVDGFRIGGRPLDSPCSVAPGDGLSTLAPGQAKKMLIRVRTAELHAGRSYVGTIWVRTPFSRRLEVTLDVSEWERGDRRIGSDTGGFEGLPVITVADPSEEAAALIHMLRGVVRSHPDAARSATQALAAEGRRFAETPEGRLLSERLEKSELVRSARILWDGLELNRESGSEEPAGLRALVHDFFSAARAGSAEEMIGDALLRGLER